MCTHMEKDLLKCNRMFLLRIICGETKHALCYWISPTNNYYGYELEMKLEKKSG